MRLMLFLPTEIYVNQEVRKVRFESPAGVFTILPRHIDCATEVTPGLLSYATDEDEEVYLAVNGGILVKCADRVLVSTENAIRGPDLDRLRDTVRNEFRELDQRARRAQTALSKLESDFIRRYLELQQ